METFKFILRMQLKEIWKNWKLQLVVFLSLVFSFIVLIVFTSKILSILELSHLARLEHKENSVLISATRPEFSEKITWVEKTITSDKHARIKTGKVILTIKGDHYQETLSIIDKHVESFYRLRHLDLDAIKDDSVAVSSTLAKQYGLASGDAITIGGKDYRIVSIFKSYQFDKRLVLSKQSDYPKGIVWTNDQLILSNPPISQLEEVSNDNELALTGLQDEEMVSIRSLKTFMIVVVTFAITFILLAIINSLLVFYGKSKHIQQKIGIKKLNGLTERMQIYSFLIENIALSTIAYHSAFLLIFMFLSDIPFELKPQINVELYVLALVEVIGMAFFYSLFLSHQMNKQSLVELVKGKF